MEEEKVECIQFFIAKLFKIDQLKDYQKSCLSSLVKGADCFVCQPTGSGKSIIYQALPFYYYAYQNMEDISNEEDLKKSTCKVLVVSPLTSLMKDQVNQMKRLGIPVTVLLHGIYNDLVSAEERSQEKNSEALSTSTIEAVKNYNIIFTSPEAILGKYREILKDKSMADLVAIVIDESHCVKKWGSTSTESVAFRSQYSNLAEIRSLVRCSIPIVALTATATNETRTFIIENLSLKSPQLFIASPGRENIKFSVINIPNAEVFLFPLLNEMKTKCYDADRVLIFCRSINDLRIIYDIFEDYVGAKFASFKNRPFAMFHSQTDEIVKQHIIEQFTRRSGTVRVLIATIAFGMGVDCKGLNTVVHFGPPSSLEDYIQEAGRAGRDGSPSDAIIVIKPRSLSSRNILKTMKTYVRNMDLCRRKLLLEEFGCTRNKQIELHDCCDVCEKTCDCSKCVTAEKTIEKPWWKSSDQLKEIVPSKNCSLNTDGISELRERLLRFRSNLSFSDGHASNDILCGFPLQCVNEIIDICHKDITGDDLYNETSILRRNIAEGVVFEIRAVFNKYCQIGNEQEDTLMLTENISTCASDNDSENSGDESDRSIEFHVNISFSDDE